jgi:hypothetical protein
LPGVCRRQRTLRWKRAAKDTVYRFFVALEDRFRTIGVFIALSTLFIGALATAFGLITLLFWSTTTLNLSRALGAACIAMGIFALLTLLAFKRKRP